ncbi:putative sterigmatocystin biosynthesis monooxygenase stcW [Cyphellophora attinorum]|uniref:Putative sterigmatocystin biosynthesis monooxygenase stcW n=1 Tax=Cyphellophora attinorum TaxID=1664694 RepID=A0A0N1GWJ7_9EURO|nr:putative sterigmatocystin biosynthesis monooxygenase stcW [Phialophora attinorum]KPI34293.1 putative sterigmatocystin biosynthesis monooxygenase stcW [Phialophora attinorum]
MGSLEYRLDSQYSDPRISERSVDQPRPIKVIYVGAGISGINAAIRLPQLMPEGSLELVVYEKNADIGGTWFENNYPGIACDIPAHSYQLSYESSYQWSKFYATGGEIQKYWLRVVEKYGVRKYMTFNHQCIEARWNERTSKWHVKFQKVGTDEVVEDIGDVLCTGTGVLNDWKWPDIPGLHDFKGIKGHSANWDTSTDLKDKNIAVIGAGSSGIQIVPALLPHVKHMDHYVRGRTWIAASFGHELVRERNDGADGNFAYTEEEKALWKKDPSAYIKYRKALECGMQGGYAVTHRGTKEHTGAWKAFEEEMRQRLTKKPEVAENLIPSFPPLCKRLTPGPGYLEALSDDKTDVIPDKIDRVDAEGIWTVDGKHRKVDAIVCATGFDTSFKGRFPVYGIDGKNLQDRYAQRPETYLSMGVDGFPNYFQSLGPNAGVGNGNLIIIIESVAAYMAQIFTKLATGNTLTIMPKRKAVEDFTNYADAFFKRTVFSAECNSWYKSSPPGTSPEDRKRGRISALWPGSSLHAVKALEKVRFEDYDMTTVDGNDFGWFGDGWTKAEREGDKEGLSWYINGTRFVEDDVVKDEEREAKRQKIDERAPEPNKPEVTKSGVVVSDAVHVPTIPNGVAAT